MGAVIGLDAKLYRNEGTYESPAWVEMKNVRNLRLRVEKGESDATTRGNNGWEAIKSTIKRGQIEWDMIWDTGDADFAAIRDAFFSDEPIELLPLDGPVTTPGSEGLRATFEVLNFSRNEQLYESLAVDVMVKPTYSAHPPDWFTAPGT